jgi:hypothetical protein
MESIHAKLPYKRRFLSGRQVKGYTDMVQTGWDLYIYNPLQVFQFFSLFPWAVSLLFDEIL